MISNAPTMIVNGTARTTLEVIGAVATAAVVAWAIRGRSRDQAMANLAIIAGAVTSCLFAEPALDAIYGVSWGVAGDDPHTVIAIFGERIPLWMVGLYVVFTGAGTIVTLDLLRRGAGRRELTLIFVAVTAADIIGQGIVLHLTDLYAYYGAGQPLFDSRLWPEPLYVAIASGSGPLLGAALVLIGPRVFGRGYLLLFPLLLPTAWFTWFLFCTGLSAASVNSSAPTAVATLLGLLAVAWTIFVTQRLLIRELPGLYTLAVQGQSSAAQLAGAARSLRP
jgi:hypothetical protein